MKDFLSHLFIPRSSNNHRARLLHHDILLSVIFLFLGLQVVTSFVRVQFPQVLGAATNIAIQDLVTATNQERVRDGLQPLTLDEKLSNAAEAKAKYMFAKDYWAHNAPDGTTPWYFIKQSGYQYEYAGENLAKGFTNVKDVMDAWMASPSHRENILSPNYTDIGFAVMDGKLQGDNTTLIVEMFGSPVGFQPGSGTSTQSPPDITAAKTNTSLDQIPAAVAKKEFSFTSTDISRSIAVVTLLLFIVVLCIDMFVVRGKKIVRIAGHNFDHILFFSIIAMIVILVGRGVIL